MKKIITCTGYHGTGSSLITDYLKEFKEIDSMGDFEFRFIQDPNGVADLEDRLLKNNSRLNSDRAIYEFLRLVKILNSNHTNRFWEKSKYRIIFKDKFLLYSQEYINKLIDIEWNGDYRDFIFRDFSFLARIKRFFWAGMLSVFKKKEFSMRFKKIYFSYPIEDFYPKTQEYLNKLFEEISEKGILALDQLVPCCNVNRYLNYFKDIKVIILDRDPRDSYIMNREIFKDGVVPSSNVHDFIKHYKLLRKHQKYEVEEESKILRIRFEDAIYKYEETMGEINKFLEIDTLTHENPKKYFNPKISIFNTQVFKLYPK